MKYALLIPLAAAVFAIGSHSEERIYRCGNEYTNTLPEGQTRGCKLLEGGNVTVVRGTRPAAAPTRASSAAAGPMDGVRVAKGEQKARDSDARQILDAELRKAQDRQAELLKEYKHGEPDRRSDEINDPRKYQDRVSELKASLVRNESDIAGLRRELSRLGATAAAK